MAVGQPNLARPWGVAIVPPPTTTERHTMKKAGTVYGFRTPNGVDQFPSWSYEDIEAWCEESDCKLVAYDVSPIRVVK